MGMIGPNGGMGADYWGRSLELFPKYFNVSFDAKNKEAREVKVALKFPCEQLSLLDQKTLFEIVNIVITRLEENSHKSGFLVSEAMRIAFDLPEKSYCWDLYCELIKVQQQLKQQVIAVNDIDILNQEDDLCMSSPSCLGSPINDIEDVEFMQSLMDFAIPDSFMTFLQHFKIEPERKCTLVLRQNYSDLSDVEQLLLLKAIKELLRYLELHLGTQRQYNNGFVQLVKQVFNLVTTQDAAKSQQKQAMVFPDQTLLDNESLYDNLVAGLKWAEELLIEQYDKNKVHILNNQKIGAVPALLREAQQRRAPGINEDEPVVNVLPDDAGFHAPHL